MSTFVLVHGAWQSPGTWDLLTPLLEKHGRRVITPILTGLGTDQKRLSPDISLTQHIEDVTMELSRFPDPVILVGHSYAGMIISGVAERNPTQVQRLVFLDALFRKMGKACWTCFRLRRAPIFARSRKSMEMGGGCQAGRANLISGD
jgi:pimeloyl-ACP methyl ester carboxylesterase